MFDLVIRDATIVDGTGAKPFISSLAVSAGKIAAIGRDLGPARETVDAAGLVLAPGMIDIHTHYDAQLTWDPLADPALGLGVTTVVIGNCGFTIAPCRPEERDLTMRNLTQVEGMSLAALRTGIRWEFESFPAYLDMLQRNGVGPNVAAFVGHSALRTYVMRDDASKRAARPDEIEAMAGLVRDAMKHGAAGFATSTSESHNGDGGVPMPSRLADETELLRLTEAMGEAGRGVFMLTKGTKTSVPFLEGLAAASGRPVLIAAILHSTVTGNQVFDELEQINAARARGRRLHAEVSCAPITVELTLHAPYLLETYPAWKPAMAAKGEALKRVYADPAFRAAVKQNLKDLHGTRIFSSEWDRVRVLETARPENRALEGRTIADLAAEQGKHPLDVVLDIGLSEDLDTIFTASYLNADETAVGRLIGDPDSLITLSDAGAHLSLLCDAGYGLHLLGHWVRDLGKMPLEEAVRRLTGQPADVFGIADRGRLKPGLAADLMLFDPAKIAPGPRQRKSDLPSGAMRLTISAVGMHGVWVNGARVADTGGPVAGAARSGRVLRDFAA